MTHPARPASAETTAAAAPPVARWLALGAVAGPLLFTVAWFVLGFLSPGYSIGGDLISPYSSISQPISGLGMGVTAPFMNTAFVLSGLLIVAGLVGVFQVVDADVRRGAGTACAALLALSPCGLVLAGLFDLEAPVPHHAGFLLITVTPVASLLLAGCYFRSVPRWRRFGSRLLVASPLTLLLVVLFFLTFDQAQTAAGNGVAGLTSRILAIEVLGWFAAMGWSAFRRCR